jgi:hypothetical protein
LQVWVLPAVDGLIGDIARRQGSDSGLKLGAFFLCHIGHLPSMVYFIFYLVFVKIKIVPQANMLKATARK